MKKLFILSVLIVTVTAGVAQSFNPYRFYKDNTTVMHGTGHVHFMEMLRSYDRTMAVHHGVKFRWNDFNYRIRGNQVVALFQSRYGNKGFNVIDGLSLIYSFFHDGVTSEQQLHPKNNFFVINADGQRYVIMVGWSDIQQKMVMTAFDENDIYPGYDQYVTLNTLFVVCRR